MAIEFKDCDDRDRLVFFTDTPEMLHITVDVPWGEEMTVTLSSADAARLREWLDRIPVATSGT